MQRIRRAQPGAGGAHSRARSLSGADDAGWRRARHHRALCRASGAGQGTGRRGQIRPLKGDKLRAALDGEAALEPELADYLAARNANKALFINIESVPALERLDEILQSPWIDCVLVGPHDLSCSLGLPEQYDHPVFDDAIRTIISKSRAAGVGIGIHHNFVHHEIEWVNAGANLVMHSSDISSFNRALTAEFKRIREETDDVGQIVDENVHF